MRSISNPHALARATQAFHARLERAGIRAPAGALAGHLAILPAADSRDAVMAAADGIAATLGALGVPCTKSKALEAFAAFRGARSWAALDASLKARPPGAAAAPRAAVEEQEDVLHRLVLTYPNAPPSELSICYFHRGDCRPEAMRLVTRQDVRSGAGKATLLEGIGPTLRALEERTTVGGRKPLTWVANEIAARWLPRWEAGLPGRGGPDLPKGELDACRELRLAGFEPTHTGGGVMLWELREGEVAYQVGDAEGSDPLAASTERPVLLTVAEGDDPEGETRELPLAAALAAVRAHRNGDRQPAPGVGAPRQ